MKTVALNMIYKDMDGLITEFTGLTLEEIEEIKNT